MVSRNYQLDKSRILHPNYSINVNFVHRTYEINKANLPIINIEHDASGNIFA